jgi:hypothetical protein
MYFITVTESWVAYCTSSVIAIIADYFSVGDYLINRFLLATDYKLPVGWDCILVYIGVPNAQAQIRCVDSVP